MDPFLGSLFVGLLGGLAAGLLGVSPGGILVPIILLVFGCDQHVAQGTSLVCQIAPTGFAGLRRYWAGGSATPWRWTLLLVAGFLVGSVGGAFVASSLSDPALRWAYVGYLGTLEVLLLTRRRPRLSDTARDTNDRRDLNSAALLAVGLAAGVSSGALGIGGGLAMVVGLSGALKLSQHQAHAVSLVVSTFPLTLPAAGLYGHRGWTLSLPIIGFLVLGLWIGTGGGARIAHHFKGETLRRLLAGLVLLSALYMASRALG